MQINVLGTKKLKATSTPSLPVFLPVATKVTRNGRYCSQGTFTTMAHAQNCYPMINGKFEPGCILKIEPTADGNLNIEVVEEFT